MKSRPYFFFLIIAFLSGLIYLLQPILAPFLLGALCAYLGDPLVNFLMRHKINRTAAVVIVFVSLTAAIVLALLLLIPLLIHQLNYLREQLPSMLQSLENILWPWLQPYVGHELPDLTDSLQQWVKTFDWQSAGDWLGPVWASVSKSGLVFIAWIGNMALVPVVSFYLLRDWPKLLIGLRELFPRRSEAQIMQLTLACHQVLGAFFRGQLLVMLALGSIYTFGLWCIGLKLALLIGLLAGLGGIVPYLGLTVGLSAAAIAAVVQYHDFFHVLLVLLVFGVGQILESTVLTPILVGDKIGLHPVAVIFSILAGAQLFGFVGMLLALPVSAIILVLLRFIHEKYLASHWYGN